MNALKKLRHLALSAMPKFKPGDKVSVYSTPRDEYYPATIKSKGKADNWIIIWDEPGNEPESVPSRFIELPEKPKTRASKSGSVTVDEPVSFSKAKSVYSKMKAHWPELSGWRKNAFKHIISRKGEEPVAVGAYLVGEHALPGLHWSAPRNVFIKKVNDVLGTKYTSKNMDDLFNLKGAYTTGLTVDSNHRGEGQGDNLLKSIQKKAKSEGAAYITFTTTEDRPAMIKLAKKHGYTKIGLSDLGNPEEEEFIYMKKL